MSPPLLSIGVIIIRSTLCSHSLLLGVHFGRYAVVLLDSFCHLLEDEGKERFVVPCVSTGKIVGRSLIIDNEWFEKILGKSLSFSPLCVFWHHECVTMLLLFFIHIFLVCVRLVGQVGVLNSLGGLYSFSARIHTIMSLFMADK